MQFKPYHHQDKNLNNLPVSSATKSLSRHNQNQKQLLL